MSNDVTFAFQRENETVADFDARVAEMEKDGAKVIKYFVVDGRIACEAAPTMEARP